MKPFLFVLALAFLPASLGFGATHTITSSGFTFSPSSPTISVGDTVIFTLTSIHNAVEVSQATWNANGTTSNGGFSVPFGGGTVVFNTPGAFYYVCQNHVLMGMKGIITVDTVPPPPPPPPAASITIGSVVDADGNLSTATDRVAKEWSLKLYQDSVGSGIVIDSAVSATSLAVTNLPAGTYVAVIADSAGWSHLARTVDGVPQSGGEPDRLAVTVAAGDTLAIDFFHFIPHAIVSSGFTFVPESLVVNAGDTVHFVLEQMHTAREVSEATWLADDTASNGGFDLPNGGGSTVLTSLGTHYYVCVPHASIGMKGKISVLTGISLQVAEGWNLLSLPIRVSDSSVAALFPSAASKAFSYAGAYVERTELSVGEGYWLKFPVASPVSLAGSEIADDTFHVSGGWNIIGTITLPVAAASVVPVGTTVVSQYFGFSQNLGYFIADTLKPGSGYWVKLSQSGALALASGGPAALPLSLFAGLAAVAGDLTIRDRSGAERHLLILPAQSDATRYELPPRGPAGILDVRFTDDLIAEAPDGRSVKSVPIAVSSAIPPLSVSWDLRGASGTWLELGAREILMQGTGETEIAQADERIGIRFSAASAVLLPGDYALRQNYPNPFNPATQLRYDLPEDARVTITIFDALGRVVTTLTDGEQKAGFHSVEWDAGNLAGGVYFYRLEATGSSGPGQRFVQVRKAVLIK